MIKQLRELSHAAFFHAAVFQTIKDDICYFILVCFLIQSFLSPGPGDQLPVLLPERRGAVGHLCALGPLEDGAGRGEGELLHPVLIPGETLKNSIIIIIIIIIPGEQPRSRLLGQCHNDPDPASGDVIIFVMEALSSFFLGFINIRKGL